MGAKVKGFLTAIITMGVLGALVWTMQYSFPWLDKMADAVGNIWIVIAIIAVLYIGYAILSCRFKRISNSFLCLICYGIIEPMAYLFLFGYAWLKEWLMSLAPRLLTPASYIAAGFAFLAVLIFAIINSALKENRAGGLACGLLVFILLGATYGVFALFRYLIKDVIDYPAFFLIYTYGFFYLYLFQSACYYTCEANSFEKRRLRLHEIVSRFEVFRND